MSSTVVQPQSTVSSNSEKMPEAADKNASLLCDSGWQTSSRIRWLQFVTNDIGQLLLADQ
jgi:hypothetical protein